VQEIPHRAGRVRLIVSLERQGRGQCKPGAVPELPCLQAAFTHKRHTAVLVYVTTLESKP
jgi:hypothetical protein